MSPAGGPILSKEIRSLPGRGVVLALLCTIGAVGYGFIAVHRPHAGPVIMPLAIGIELFPPTDALAAQPAVAQAKSTATSGNTMRRTATMPQNVDGTAQAVLRKPEVGKSEEAAASGVRVAAAKIATARDAAPAVLISAPLRPTPVRARDDDGDRGFAAAFSQAAAPLTDMRSAAAVSTIDRRSLSIASVSVAADAADMVTRQAGGARYVSGGVSAANRLGAVAIKSDAQIGHLDTAGAAYKPSYDAVNVRTSFTVPAFHHPVQVSVGGGYERMLQTGGPHLNSLDMPPTIEGSAAIDGAGAASALNNAGRLSLNRAGYATSVTVPIAGGVNVGVGYAQRNVNGGAGMTQAAPIDERQHLYTGSVTYQGRGGRSSLSLIGRESHATDSTATAPDTKIRRGDLVFSVKF